MRFGLRWVRHLRRAEPHSGIQSRLNVPPGVSVFAGHAIAGTRGLPTQRDRRRLQR
jgi:hypothetical protein